MKIREFPESNYRAIFSRGKTIRIPLDPTKKITELKYPEFYDLAINGSAENGMCKTGGCSYCYTSANKKGYYTKNAAEKVYDYFSKLDDNQKPFQWAIGGNGEPTEHPEFIELLKVGNQLGIVPNYTTNGVLVSTRNVKLLEATKKYCGGVAVTCHPHLEFCWRRAIDVLLNNEIKVNIHLVISDKASIDNFINIYNQYNGKIDYFVLLPYMNVGFAAENRKNIDFDYLEKFLDKIAHYANIAFGSNFYPWLKTRGEKYNVSLYEPEILSKYIVFENDRVRLFKNSFELKEITKNK